jgi:5-(carboxyamino)imidazole ribonucleotide synthase
MENLLGAEAAGWREAAAAGAVTLYGKREAAPGRKMGHVVRLDPPAPVSAGGR